LSTSPGAAPPKSLVTLHIASVSLIWGSTFAVIRTALDEVPPFLLGAVRMALAGLVLLAWLKWRGVRFPAPAQLKTLLVMSFWMVLVSNGLLNVAEQSIPSGMAAISAASMPLWFAAFSAARGERVHASDWRGMIVGLAGVVVLAADGTLETEVGHWLALMAIPAAWAWGSVWSKAQDLPGPAMSAAIQFLFGAVQMLLVGLLLGETMEHAPSARILWSIAYLAFFGSIAAFSSYLWLVRNVRPALSTVYAYANPVVALAIGVGFLGEAATLRALVALSLIALGLWTLQRGRAVRR
jgi:drug/metabolite transporter (DMT)-like permease